MNSTDRPDSFRSPRPVNDEGDSPASSAINAERLRDQLISEGGRRGTTPQVFDKDLLYIVARMYRADAVYGTGSTPDALRVEIQTGKKTRDHEGRPTQHWWKTVDDLIPNLMKWIREHPTAHPSDKNAAWNMLFDCCNAVKRRPPSRATVEDAAHRLPTVEQLERE